MEKRIPEVEAQLREEIGGEFRVDGVYIDDVSSWAWVCTELETGCQFAIDYLNFRYLYQSKEMEVIENKYENGLRYDSFNSCEEEEIAELIKRGELSVCLRDNSIFDSENNFVQYCQKQKICYN